MHLDEDQLRVGIKPGSVLSEALTYINSQELIELAEDRKFWNEMTNAIYKNRKSKTSKQSSNM